MQMVKEILYVVAAAICLSDYLLDFVAACSCSRMHPQEYFCTADFVIVADVHRFSIDKKNYTRVYKVKIRKEYKASIKAREALSYGRLQTPATDSTCGARLEPGKRYLLAGRISGNGKPWVSLCNWVQEWNTLTPGQKKGVRRLYYRGCDCKVQACHWWDERCPNYANHCPWQTSATNGKDDCQADHAVCYRGPTGYCQWSQPKSYKSCLKRYARKELAEAKSQRKVQEEQALTSAGLKSVRRRNKNKESKEKKKKARIDKFELTPLVEVVRNF